MLMHKNWLFSHIFGVKLGLEGVYVISIFMIFVSRFLTLLLVNLKTLKKKISYLTNLVINHERDGSFAMDVMIL